MDNFVCFFVNKRINDKHPFPWWANGKQIDENCLGFCFLFSIWNGNIYTIYSSVFQICINIYAAVLYIYIYRNGTNGKRKFAFLGGRITMNGNWWLLFQQTCLSLDDTFLTFFLNIFYVPCPVSHVSYRFPNILFLSFPYLVYPFSQNFLLLVPLYSDIYRILSSRWSNIPHNFLHIFIFHVPLYFTLFPEITISPFPLFPGILNTVSCTYLCSIHLWLFRTEDAGFLRSS
jgi:hypothetical protein